jgi:type VI secretion system protein ImpJ
MTSLNAIPEAVLWEEGMLLSPQHFQQAAQRHEALLHYHTHLLHPFHRGVVELEWDAGQLPRNVLRVRRLEAVMPDGLAVRHHIEETLEVDLSAKLDEARVAPMRIWLAVPAQRAAHEPLFGNLSRMRATEGDRVVDESTGHAVVVRRARPVLRLHAGSPPGDAYVSLPIAEVTVQEEALVFTGYVPPLLQCRPDTVPYQWCSLLAQQTRNRGNELAQRGVPNEALLRTIRVMAAGLPPFEAVLNTERAHPFVLYQALCALAGWLAGSVPGLAPPFKAYDHDNLAASFHEVRQFVASVLGRVARTRQRQPFDPIPGGFRLPVLNAEWVRDGALVVGLLAAEGMTETDAANWMKECQIGSEARLEALRLQRFTGAVRERVTDTAALNMAPGRREVLFRVIVDAESVAEGKPLVIVHPNGPAGKLRPAAASLYTS